MPTNKIIYGLGRVPKASEFAVGEIIINLDDAKVYSKDKQNVVFEIAGSTGNPDGFKFAYLSSLFESGSVGWSATDTPYYINNDYLLGLTDVDFTVELSDNDIIKIVSASTSTFHTVDTVHSSTSASISPPWAGNAFYGDSADDVGIIKMLRNKSGSLLITSSLSNRNIIFSGSSGIKITTGSELHSIEISIDGTSVSPQSDNIQGTLFTLNDTTGQTRVDFTPDGDIESGDTISATVPGLGEDSIVSHGSLNLANNITVEGATARFSGIPENPDRSHVIVYSPNVGAQKLEYAETASIIAVIQNPIDTRIRPYDPYNADLIYGDTETHNRVGGVYSDTLIPAGTSIESILRDILVEFVEAEIINIQARDAGTVKVPPAGNTAYETGDSITDIDNFKIFGQYDGDGEFFDSYELTLAGNDTDNGTIEHTINGSDNQPYLSFTSPSVITVNRDTPGEISFSLTGISDSPYYTKNDSLSMPFNNAIFCGNSQNQFGVGTLSNDYNRNAVLADISGSHSTPTVPQGSEDSRDGYYGVQTLISYTNGVRVEESPSTTLFPDIGSTVTDRGVTIKTDSFGGTPTWYTYIAYPASYGLLSSIQIIGQSSNIISDFTYHEPAVWPVTRFGVTTNYRLYRSFLSWAYPNAEIRIKN